MSTPRWLIDRRTMLRGLGVTMALPLLNVMMAPGGYGADTKVVPRKVPVRFCAMYVPNGLIPANRNDKTVDDWTPKDPSLTKLSAILAPLDKVRNSVVVLSGLHNALPLKNAPPHITRTVGFLCSSLVDGGINTGKGLSLDSGSASIDQVIAEQLGQFTKIPSLELSMEAMRKGHSALNGDNQVYGCHLSWSSPNTPVAAEIHPKAVFDRLFRTQVADGKKNMTYTSSTFDDHSVLDSVIENLTAFRTGLGIEDKRKLEEYATSVRELEKRLERELKSASARPKTDPAALRSLAELNKRVGEVDVVGLPSDGPVMAKLMMDILTLAFWTDTTRICTFLWGREIGNRNFSFLEGVSGSHHTISHHESKPDQLKAYTKICTWHIEQYAYLINRLSELKEGADTVLDNSMLLIGSGVRDGDKHDGKNLPILLAGGGGRTIKGGRHLNFPNEPLANLHCEIASRMGLPLQSFADSTGPLKGL